MDYWIIYLAFLLQNGSGDWILDGDEGRVGHGPRGEGGHVPPRPPGSATASFFRIVTIHAFDRGTDRRTVAFLMAIPCVALHAVARLNDNEVAYLVRLPLPY